MVFFFLDTSVGKILGHLYKGIYVGPGRYNYIRQNKFDCLVMGSSTSKSLYADILSQQLGISILNVGLDGAALIYSRCLLELVLQNRVAPRIILLNLDLFEMRKDAWSGNFYSMIESFAPFYGTSKYIDKALQKDRPFELLKYCLESFKYNDMVLTIFLKAMLGEKIYRREPAPVSAVQLPIDDKILKEKFPENVEIDRRKLELYREFITTCKKNDITLIVIISPVFNPNTSGKGDKQLKNMVKKITDDSNTPFIDITGEKYPVFRDPKLFYDVLHLNDRGSRIFSHILSRELKVILN